MNFEKVIGIYLNNFTFEALIANDFNIRKTIIDTPINFTKQRPTVDEILSLQDLRLVSMQFNKVVTKWFIKNYNHKSWVQIFKRYESMYEIKRFNKNKIYTIAYDYFTSIQQNLQIKCFPINSYFHGSHIYTIDIKYNNIEKRKNFYIIAHCDMATFISDFNTGDRWIPWSINININTGFVYNYVYDENYGIKQEFVNHKSINTVDKAYEFVRNFDKIRYDKRTPMYQREIDIYIRCCFLFIPQINDNVFAYIIKSIRDDFNISDFKFSWSRSA